MKEADTTHLRMARFELQEKTPNRFFAIGYDMAQFLEASSPPKMSLYVVHSNTFSTKVEPDVQETIIHEIELIKGGRYYLYNNSNLEKCTQVEFLTQLKAFLQA